MTKLQFLNWEYSIRLFFLKNSCSGVNKVDLPLKAKKRDGQYASKIGIGNGPLFVRADSLVKHLKWAPSMCTW